MSEKCVREVADIIRSVFGVKNAEASAYAWVSDTVASLKKEFLDHKDDFKSNENAIMFLSLLSAAAIRKASSELGTFKNDDEMKNYMKDEVELIVEEAIKNTDSDMDSELADAYRNMMEKMKEMMLLFILDFEQILNMEAKLKYMKANYPNAVDDYKELEAEMLAKYATFQAVKFAKKEIAPSQMFINNLEYLSGDDFSEILNVSNEVMIIDEPSITESMKNQIKQYMKCDIDKVRDEESLTWKEIMVFIIVILIVVAVIIGAIFLPNSRRYGRMGYYDDRPRNVSLFTFT